MVKIVNFNLIKNQIAVQIWMFYTKSHWYWECNGLSRKIHEMVKVCLMKRTQLRYYKAPLCSSPFKALVYCVESVSHLVCGVESVLTDIVLTTQIKFSRIIIDHFFLYCTFKPPPLLQVLPVCNNNHTQLQFLIRKM